MTSPMLHLPPKVEQSDNVRVITLSANKVRDVVDLVARELEGRTDRLGAGHLLLDFANVEQLGSAELGTLVTLHKRMKASGGRLTLFNLRAQVYEVFAVTHLHTVLSICREGGADPGGGGRATAHTGKVGEAAATGSAGDSDKFVYCE